MYRFIFTSKEALRMFVDLLEKERLFELQQEWFLLYKYSKGNQAIPLSYMVNERLQVTQESSSNIIQFVFQKGIREIRNERQDLVSKVHFLDVDPTIWNLLNNIKKKHP